MKGRLIGVFALLSASAARAGASEPYATVGHWEISAEDEQQCSMSQMFGSKDPDEAQLLGFIYDAKKGVALSWASNKPKYLLSSGAFDLDLAFLRGRSSDESWGSQEFSYRKVGKTYYLTHVFAGADADLILRDVSSNEIVALFFGPTLMMSLPLDASGAVEKLRECTSRRVP